MAANSFIAPSTPLDRRHLGKYEVLCRLSTGGMSAIYLAHQTGLAGFKKLVVLKTILPDIGGEEDFVGMFLEEARITAAFNHPNIAQVFELDTDDGQLFMAMEFVQGCTLVEMARACRQAKESIPIGFTLSATRDTALALHYAHNFTDARGRKQIVIHRDVAEKNIMVTYEGVTKLLDFGIAKALGRSGRTSIGMVKGTSGYMSPEQIRGEPLDPRSDIFALGVVMHECLTGLRLFHGKTAEEGMMAALREEVQPPSRWNKEVSPELDAVVLKALQRDREKRFSTALEFARAIEKAAPALLWHPEQLGEVVSRHFNERRAETRRLLESAEFGSETTGEVRVKSVLAKVRASAGGASSATTSSGTPAHETKPEPPRSSPEPARKPSLISAPKVTMPRDEPEQTRPGVMPEPTTRPQGMAGINVSISAPKVSMPNEEDAMTRPGVMPGQPETPSVAAAPSEGTSPARPRALRAPPPTTTPGAPQLPPRQFDYDDDDDVGDKTIPAAALPDEIKNLRAQFLAARKNAAPPNVVTEPIPPSVVAEARAATDRVAAAQELTPAHPSPVPAPPPAPPRTTSGETISITSKGSAMDWEDDDEGAKTAIARPGELPGQALARLSGARPKPSPQPFAQAPLEPPVMRPSQRIEAVPPPSYSDIQPAHAASDTELPQVQSGAYPELQPGLSGSYAELQPTGSQTDLPPLQPPRRTGLVVALVVLALLAVLGVLVLLDIIPLPKPARPRPVGALVQPAPPRPS